VIVDDNAIRRFARDAFNQQSTFINQQRFNDQQS